MTAKTPATWLVFVGDYSWGVKFIINTGKKERKGKERKKGEKSKANACL